MQYSNNFKYAAICWNAARINIQYIHIKEAYLCTHMLIDKSIVDRRYSRVKGTGPKHKHRLLKRIEGTGEGDSMF